MFLHNQSFFSDPIFTGLIVALIMNTKAGAMTVNIFYPFHLKCRLMYIIPVLSMFLQYRNGMRQKGVG